MHVSTPGAANSQGAYQLFGTGPNLIAGPSSGGGQNQGFQYASDGTVTVTGPKNPNVWTGVTVQLANGVDYTFVETIGDVTCPSTTDTTPPVLSLPGNMTAEATSSSGAAVSFTASATDDNPAQPQVTCTPASGSTFAIGTTPVTCSATDAAGNTASGTFTVKVQDTTPPVISGTPANITAEATGPGGAAVSYTAPTASDLVDGSRPVTCTPTSGATFSIGTTTVTCSATDTHGNPASTTFTVKVQDTTPPVISGTPANITAEATGPGGAAVSYTAPTASDLVDGSRPVTCTPTSGAIFSIGTTTVTCSATDTHGNPASTTFTVKVQDTTPPNLALPGPITTDATSPGGAIVTFTATANDLVDGNLPVSCTPASGATFAIKTTTVTCTAADTRNNTSSGTFTVTVKSATTQVADQITLVGNLTGVSAATKPSLIAKLNDIETSLAGGQINTACNQLGAYVNQIMALQGKQQITQSAATQLVNNANRIMSVLGC
jgi:hypothetical protein